MNSSQEWVKHYASVKPEIQNTFLEIKVEDCREVLETIDLPLTNGISYESAENRVFGFDSVVIKFYRPGRWSFKALQEEVHFLKDLQKADVPFVKPIGNVGTWRGVHYVIFDKIKEPYFSDREVLDEDSVRKMVHLVARIHDVGEKRNAPSRAQFNPRAMSSGCFEVIKKAGFLPKALEKRYEEVIDGLVKKIEELGDVPIQRIHGDTYSGNILWKENEPVFMDLDDFQVGPVALDVRLLSFPWRLDTLSESLDRQERRKIQHNMVLGMYREVRPFPQIQEKILPLLGAYRDIQFDAWFSARWKEPNFASKYQDDDITASDYWEDSVEGLEEDISK